MKLYTQNKNYKLYNGNMLDMLEDIKENSIDSIITDPPYELNFMNKGWDNSGIAFQKETWKKCFKVLKPGGYLLAFGGSRTFHRIACAIEDAGFEIRDTIMWLYGSGFPKSMDISKALDKKEGNKREIVGYTNNAGIAKDAPRDATGSHIWTGNLTSNEAIGILAKQWQGWGTALKPSFEPIIVARKPFKGSLVDNVIKYGVGGINIDECRVGNEERQNPQAGFIRRGRTDEEVFMGTDKNRPEGTLTVNGRFPANTILTYDETDFDEVCGGFPYTKNGGQNETSHRETWVRQETTPTKFTGDSGSASRYFYCAKASAKDRNEGLDVEIEEYVLKEDTPQEIKLKIEALYEK
jgi:site-specific DNA-methyltransferase (adenine-specific)